MNEVVLKQYIYCDLENKKGGTADSKVIDNQTLSVTCMWVQETDEVFSFSIESPNESMHSYLKKIGGSENDY